MMLGSHVSVTKSLWPMVHGEFNTKSHEIHNVHMNLQTIEDIHLQKLSGDTEDVSI